MQSVLYMTSGRGEANARLIAAAPEMLAALKGCGCICYSEVAGPPHDERCDAVEAAIAKAEGD